MNILLDSIDIAILKILQKDGRASIKSIAEQVYVSSPTVATRIEAMEKGGIILGYSVKINENIMGNPVKAFVNLELLPKQKEELYSFLRGSSNVIECSHVTGEYSVLIKSIFKNTEELERFIGKLQDFGRTKTQIVFSSVIDHRGFSLDSAVVNDKFNIK